jgi:hypothetical protein
MLCSQLVNEMRAFPDGHTGDSLMALWFAFGELRDLTGSKYTIPSTLGTSVRDVPEAGLKDNAKFQEDAKKLDIGRQLEHEYERRMFAGPSAFRSSGNIRGSSRGVITRK